MNSSIRVRFAPSPTGHLHVGGLRTALYNFLFARKNKGTFILRIEDTDRSRQVEGAVESLIGTLAWAGIVEDEGPSHGGAAGPYVQSERLSLYREHAEKLLGGWAYRCFCTPARLDEMRREQEKRHLPQKYDRKCLGLSSREIEENLRNGIPSVVRLKIPDGQVISVKDLVRGDLEFSSEVLDDQVLLKSDGFPTYHLANVVDDHAMRISHVIRGEEWLSSTPKHVLLYESFGWKPPAFAHLPLLLNPDRSKLSKRQGDVAVEEYRVKGFLSEALVNIVALLGWNPGTDKEIFSMEELISEFDLGHVNKAGAVFSIDKLTWLNSEHLRRKSKEELLAILRHELSLSKYRNMKLDDASLLRIVDAMRERVTLARDFIDKAPYFYEPPTLYDEAAVRKRWSPRTPELLEELAKNFSALRNPGKEQFQEKLEETAASSGVGNGDLIHAVRLAVSGVGGGPGVYDILEILGKDESVKRIRTALERIR